MKQTAKLSSDFRLTIPKSVREENGWHNGQTFTFIPKNGGVLLIPVPSRDELFGIAKGANPNGYRERENKI